MKLIFITTLFVLLNYLEARSSGFRNLFFLNTLDLVADEEFFEGTIGIGQIDMNWLNFSKEQPNQCFFNTAYKLKSVVLSNTESRFLARFYQEWVKRPLSDHTWDDFLGGSWPYLNSCYWDEGELEEQGEFFLETDGRYLNSNNGGMTLVEMAAMDNPSIEAVFYANQPERAIEMLGQTHSILQLSDNINRVARIQDNPNYTPEKAIDFEQTRDQNRSNAAMKHSMLNKDLKSLEWDVRYQVIGYQGQIKRQTEDSRFKESALQKGYIPWRLQINVISLLALLILAIGCFFWQRIFMEQLHEQKLRELEQSKYLEIAQARINAQEQERIRIAEDLHDRLGCTLTAVKMHLEAEVSKNRTANKYLDKSCKLIDRAIDETREISYLLISGVLVKLGLPAALADLKETFLDSDQLDINLEIKNYAGLPRKVELQLFRITEQLVNNSITHSGGGQISIKLEQQYGATHLIVADNGFGFDQNKEQTGLGLLNIHRRLEAISGTMKISSDGGGSCFAINVPVIN